MSVRLRLTRVGGKKDPIWRVVVADQRSPRDGRVIETIGHYNAQTDPSTIVIDEERARSWLARGAQPSDTVRKLLRIQGIELRGSALTAGEPGADDGRSREHPIPARFRRCWSTSPKASSTSPRRCRSSSSRRTTARSCSSCASPTDDYGKVIGRGGRTAHALRTVVKAAATGEGRHVLVDIVD